MWLWNHRIWQSQNFPENSTCITNLHSHRPFCLVIRHQKSLSSKSNRQNPAFSLLQWIEIIVQWWVKPLRCHLETNLWASVKALRAHVKPAKPSFLCASWMMIRLPRMELFAPRRARARKSSLSNLSGTPSWSALLSSFSLLLLS